MDTEKEAMNLLAEYVKEAGGDNYVWNCQPRSYPAGQKILNSSPQLHIAVVRILLNNPFAAWKDGWKNSSVCDHLQREIVRRKLPYTAPDLLEIVTEIGKRFHSHYPPPIALFRSMSNSLKSPEILEACREPLLRLREKIMMPAYDQSYQRKFQSLLDELIGNQPEVAVSVNIRNDDWGNQATSALERLEGEYKNRWLRVLHHAQSVDGSQPSKSWQEYASQLVKKFEVADFRKQTLEWIGFLQRFTAGAVEETREYTFNDTVHRYVVRSPHAVLNDNNVNIIKGLVWSLTALESTNETARVLGQVTEWSLRKVQGIGPRAPRIANAAVYVLGQMNTPAAIAQLARLKTRVTFKTTLKEIEKALDAAAKKAGVSKADLEEMGVPTFGLEAGGVRRETLGEVTAELRVSGKDVSLNWFDAKGKALKNPPASVKRDFAEELKELKAAQKDIAGMLTALSARLDGLYLAGKSWPLAVWRERYLEHPLMGTLARRLIWKVGGVGLAVGPSGGLEAPNGEQPKLANDAVVTLWHPLEASVDEVVRWREWLERHNITQPFKQAHREVYLLTDAERRTATYSNRYAAHILKQHQFNALCALRGWNNRLRLMVDDSYPPATLELPLHGLRAEFWIEGAGTEYGVDSNESGTYLYLSADQVRFYPAGAPVNAAHAGGGGYEMWLVNGADPVNPIPLEQIPPLVFSEVMRDVDLFVGVCSVGNDPTWQDGGPQGRYRDYWQSYSFGELSATAQTRKELLSRLIPRLRIAGQCELEGRFLRVRGSLRTYKIHLGSSNILMEPNDQYLCIVPGQSGEVSGNVFLPFEGDRTLSVILSKAFLLAADEKITDPTIIRQIK